MNQLFNMHRTWQLQGEWVNNAMTGLANSGKFCSRCKAISPFVGSWNLKKHHFLETPYTSSTFALSSSHLCSGVDASWDVLKLSHSFVIVPKAKTFPSSSSKVAVSLPVWTAIKSFSTCQISFTHLWECEVSSSNMSLAPVSAFVFLHHVKMLLSESVLFSLRSQSPLSFTGPL